MTPERHAVGRFSLLCLLGVAVLSFIRAPIAGAEVICIDFEEFVPGQVVVGELPGGGTIDAGLFSHVVFSIASEGPHNSLVIFDSSHPTGGDFDLGTPHQDFGGPGVGLGGAAGTPGENAQPLGNVLIIAEDLHDFSPEDGLVDDPDDEARGGLITADFPVPVTVDYIKILDMDDRARGSSIKLYDEVSLLADIDIPLLGDNSVQTIDLHGYHDLTRMEIFFRGSGAIAELQFHTTPTAVEITTWGKIKSRYR